LLFSPQYYLAALPALAILLGLGLRRIRVTSALGAMLATAIPVALLLLPLAAAVFWRFGVAAGAASVPAYSMREAEILAAGFWNAGYSFSDVQRHLRGPASLGLIAAMAPF